MAHIHKKMKKGRPYYYIREIARVHGKPKVVNQIYLGSPERILQMAAQTKENTFKIQVQEFGALWLADLIDQNIDFAKIVDSVILQAQNEKGPTVGEYFLFAAFNRMVDTCSKRAFPQWFKETAINQIRPVDTQALDSQRFWDKWDRVTPKQLAEIARRFFIKITQIEAPGQGCFLFDTTNYYTYMATETESNLAKRGKNKDGKNWLRQIGLALLVSRKTGLPIHYLEYEGNQHDSKVFAQIIEQMISRLNEILPSEAELTIVVDKGMNSEENMTFIDHHERLHFITTYSAYFSTELMEVNLDEFKHVNIPKNRALRESGHADDQIRAFRNTGQYWKQERTVVVTYNPRTARKQRYTLERKLSQLRKELYIMQAKMRAQVPHWRKPKEVEKRYDKICDQMHISKYFYDLSFEKTAFGWQLAFQKNPKNLRQHTNQFGKNIIITDQHYWSTDEIVKVSLDRWRIENTFRQTKDDNLVSAMPIRHWTDSKIYCHFLSCMVALTYLNLIELQLKRPGLDMTASTAMRHMHRLHSCLCWSNRKRKPVRIIEQPTKIQSNILNAFNHKISTSGVLQPISS